MMEMGLLPLKIWFKFNCEKLRHWTHYKCQMAPVNNFDIELHLMYD